MSNNEPKLHFFRGGNIIVDTDRELTAEELKKVAEAAESFMESQQPEYINPNTGKKHTRVYALTEEQTHEIQVVLDKLLELSKEYDAPMFATVQVACDPLAFKTPSKISGVSNTIPPRSSDGFDLVQSIVKMVFEKGITESEYHKLYDCVKEIVDVRKAAGKE